MRIALKSANFLVKNQLRKGNGLNRNFKDGKSNINGYSEDYAAVIKSFISLYEVTLDEKWLTTSKKLLDYLFVNFFDKNTHMFYFTSKEDESLIARKHEIIDGVIPSSNSIIANSLFKLGHYYSDTKYLKTSEQMLNNLKDDIQINPANYSNWLSLMTNFTKPFYEVVVAGKNANKVNKELINSYIPNVIIAGTVKDNTTLPLLAYKFNEDETLNICLRKWYL